MHSVFFKRALFDIDLKQAQTAVQNLNLDRGIKDKDMYLWLLQVLKYLWSIFWAGKDVVAAIDVVYFWRCFLCAFQVLVIARVYNHRRVPCVDKSKKMCNKKNILIYFHSAESLCRAQKGKSN